MAKPAVIGSYYWATGPLVIGSAAVRKLIQVKRDAAARKLLQRVRGISTIEVAGERVLVFPKQLPTTWKQLGPRSGVAIRASGPGIKPAALGLDPWAVPAAAWKKFLPPFRLLGGPKRALFDAIARLDQPLTGTDATAIDLALPAGDYVADRAVVGERDFQVTLYRIRPPDAAPTPPTRRARKPQPGPPAELILRPATVALARKLTFVSTDGGPMLAAPRALLTSWRGTFDDAGDHCYGKAPCDYDRACAAKGLVMRIGQGQALVLDQFAVAFLARPDDTALILFWVGADEAAHVLEAVLAATTWKRTRQSFTTTGRELAFLDAADDGRAAKPAFVGKLAPGTYRIDRMTEFDGQIRAGQRLHGVMAKALRLTKV